MTSIGEYAFYGCSSLAAIKIPEGVTTIGKSAFYGCSVLTRFSLSPAVSIGEDCFWNCDALFLAAADQNMSTVEDLLHSRWHRICDRVTVLSCLKTLLTDQPRRLDSNGRENALVVFVTKWILALSDRLKRKRLGGGEASRLGVIAARGRLPKVMWRVILEFL